MNIDISEEALVRIVADVVAEQLGTRGSSGLAKGPFVHDASGVMGIDAPRIKTEPFPLPLPRDVSPNDVRLIDLLTEEESPRVGCGLMEMDHTCFPWTLKYDEVDYVISGTLDIIIDGRLVRATAGQVIFIPKNTSIQFSTPDSVRFFYVVYPINWSEQ